MDENKTESQNTTAEESETAGSSFDARTDEAIKKSKDLGRQAMEQTKEAVENARSAVLALITDPMGGQRQAWENLGSKKAMPAGVVLLAASVLCLWIGGRTFLGQMPIGSGIGRVL